MTGHRNDKRYQYIVLGVLLVLGVSQGEIDRTKYITLDEIRTDMEAYARTVWYGTEIETFPLKILSVVRNRQPGEDMILVVGTDERFKLAGAVRGCSGSPVFIDGRLAGALAAGWSSAKEPLYLVRPIEAMLEVGTQPTVEQAGQGRRIAAMDFSRPLDLAEVAHRVTEAFASRVAGDNALLPLATSLPAHVCSELAEGFGSLGVVPIPGGLTAAAASQSPEEVTFERGGVLSVVLCSGDINLAAVGTVTEVDGDTVFGFGHSFTGIGQIEFPMSTGYVHSVIASRDMSFKLATPGAVAGTLQFDQYAAVRGQIGRIPAMVPMRVTVDRYNDPKVRTYACRLAYDREYTPMIGRLVAQASALMQGPLPPEHTVSYQGRIAVKDGEPITFENISSGRSVTEVGSELLSTLTLLLNNPFDVVKPESIELDMVIEPADSTAAIWSAQLSKAVVKPGQTITVEVMLQTFREARATTSIELKIPETMPAGKYPLQLLGATTYNSFLNQNAPQRFRVVDTQSLVTGLNRVLNMPRNRLYVVLPVPATGLAMRRHELPDLPPTRMALLQDARRLQPMEPYKNWVESNVELDKIVSGAAQIELTVEQP
jgi:hypothetical protein